MQTCSIIIPALNEAAGIAATLQPLQAARQRGHELILVDGGSTDDTCRIAAGQVDRLLRCAAGRAAQMNHGARFAAGDVYIFLHADTRLPPEFDRILNEHGVSRHTWGRFDIRLSGAHPMFRCIEKLMNIRSRLTGIATGDQCIVIGRALFQQTNGYAAIPLMEDVELSGRLSGHSAPVCVKEPVISSARRWEQHGILKTVLLSWKLRLCYALGYDPHDLVKQYY